MTFSKDDWKRRSTPMNGSEHTEVFAKLICSTKPEFTEAEERNELVSLFYKDDGFIEINETLQKKANNLAKRFKKENDPEISFILTNYTKVAEELLEKFHIVRPSAFNQEVIEEIFENISRYGNIKTHYNYKLTAYKQFTLTCKLASFQLEIAKLQIKDQNYGLRNLDYNIQSEKVSVYNWETDLTAELAIEPRDEVIRMVELPQSGMLPFRLFVGYVSMTYNDAIVEGKSEESDSNNGYLSRRFVRRFSLPHDYVADNVISTLSSDGILTVNVPKSPEIEEKGREIPIQCTRSPSVKANPSEQAKEDSNEN
uniref:SHSP domain-containing protein n=1 Tax=Glossina brevipalpis TaxID=37001 RepID=A0A1A9WS56_9MUSC